MPLISLNQSKDFFLVFCLANLLNNLFVYVFIYFFFFVDQAWFQNRRRKEVIVKERSNSDKTFSKNSENPTVPAFSSTTSLIPSVILVSIVKELKQFAEKEKKVKRKTECERNLPLSSCQSNSNSSTENQTLLKSEIRNSISKKHSIYFSAFDIKSPPNQITPTVAFNLRSDLYRGPFEVFSTEKIETTE